MPSDDDAGSTDDEAVVSPDELDISENDKVVEIDEGRYVIGTSGGEPRKPPDEQTPTDPTERDSEPAIGESAHPDQEGPVELSDEVVHEWLEDYLKEVNSDYGFDITAKFDGSVKNQQLFSNDVVTSFENLLLWYAQQVGSNTPIEEVLGILLVESNIPIKYPPEVLQAMVKSQGLSTEDAIGELLESTTENDGFELPR